ncbi:MAG: hypothetical protein WD898_00200 [Candidatus Paceibacterota bacterium]
MLPKFFKLIKEYQTDLLLAVFVVLISVISFNLGKISAFNRLKTPITITEPNGITEANMGSGVNPQEQPVVASKASSGKLYHFLWCSGAQRIAEKNKLTFPNEAAALAAGYALASNCSK